MPPGAAAALPPLQAQNSGRGPGAPRRLFARRHRRGRPGRPGRGRADDSHRRSQRPPARRHRLRRRGGARWPDPDQQPRRRRGQHRQFLRAHRGDDAGRPAPHRAAGRRRSRHRSGADPHRRAGDLAGGAARRFQAPEARPTGDRHRQSARLRIDGDDRRRLGARPQPALAHRPADRRRDPDRCGAQSRQFRRPAGVLARRSRRREHRGDHGRARHLLCGRRQYRKLRARRTGAPRPGAPRLHRRRRPAHRRSRAGCATPPASRKNAR